MDPENQAKAAVGELSDYISEIIVSFNQEGVVQDDEAHKVQEAGKIRSEVI